MRKAVLPLFTLFFLCSPTLALALTGLPDFTSLVKQNHKAVVNISTRQGLSRSGTDQELDERIEEFRRGEPGRSPFEESGLGSGFIISDDGFVMTNNHVVEGASTVLVRLHDRRELIARVVGTDPRSDVALLKVDADNLPSVKIGNSDALEVGEWVLAIGSPFGFDFSVTSGIVSAIGRALPNESYVPFIQTDVAINPGNSGGPLFNLEGEVIGINSQIYSRTGSFSGLSFAIPIELAMDVSRQLMANGVVSRGWLGVHIQEVNRELADRQGMDIARGALVTRIVENGPASRSRLRVNDVITHFDGKPVERQSSLPPLVGRVPVNTDAQLTVVRDGREIAITVNIGELPSPERLAQTNRAFGGGPRANVLQMEVEPLDTGTREELGIDKGGVVVSSVVANGPAGLAGVEPGDALLMVDNKPVDSVVDFKAVVEEVRDNKSVAILVQRSEGPMFLALEIE